MKFESHVCLTKMVIENPKIITDAGEFEWEMRHLIQKNDPSGYDHLLSVVGAPELMRVVRRTEGETLSKEQREENKKLAWSMLNRLNNKGKSYYGSMWAINCWMNALTWPFCLIDEEYVDTLDYLSDSELEDLVNEQDGVAISLMAQRMLEEENEERAAELFKIAYDCCDIYGMRILLTNVQESDEEIDEESAEYIQMLVYRLASLGDPLGLAWHAQKLIDEGEDLDMALTMATCSAEEGCAAGYYALYECLRIGYKMNTDQGMERQYLEAMANALNCAQMGKDPRAIRELERLKHNETGTSHETGRRRRRGGDDLKIPFLWECICGVLAQLDQEMVDATGEPVEDAVLVCTMLVCLRGAIRFYDDEHLAAAANRHIIEQFNTLMPDFADKGIDRDWLMRMSDSVNEQIERRRAQSEELVNQEGLGSEGPLQKRIAVEKLSIFSMIHHQINGDGQCPIDSSALQRIIAAVDKMLSALAKGLPASSP